MKIDRFLQLFVVKEKKFYPLYKELGNTAVEVADKLLVLLQEHHPEQQTGIYKIIKAEEVKGDHIRNTLFDELKNTFVTPFDREDVHTLALRIDNFIDFVHDASRRVVMYKAKRIDDPLISMGKYILEDARVLNEIMSLLESVPKKNEVVRQLCDRINDIEHRVDDLYEQYMGDVFANEKDAIELVKLKNIVQALEDATDKAKEVSDAVRSIILKFA